MVEENTQNTVEDRLFNQNKAAKEMGFTRQYVAALIKEGRLAVELFDRNGTEVKRIRESEIRRFMAAHHIPDSLPLPVSEAAPVLENPVLEICTS